MHNINFLPWRSKRQAQLNMRFFSVFFIGLFVFLVIQVFIFYYIRHQTSAIERAISQRDVARQAWGPQQQQYDVLKEEQIKLNDQITRFSYLIQNKYRVTYVLNLLPSLMSKGLFLQQLTIKAERVVLKGASQDLTLIRDFVHQLKEQPELSHLEIHSMKKSHTSSDLQVFSMSFRLVNLSREIETKEHQETKVDSITSGRRP